MISRRGIKQTRARSVRDRVQLARSQVAKAKR